MLCKTFCLVAGFTWAMQGTEMPAWWRQMLALRQLSAQFTQESQSDIFGTMKKTGTLQMQRPGCLRVAYDGGLCLTANGITLVQYDPQTRTASRIDMKKATKEVPLLSLLLDQDSLSSQYHIEVQSTGAVILTPLKAASNPKVTLQGEGPWLKRILWKDMTGAQQSLTLSGITTQPISSTTFQANIPKNARWIGSR